MPGEETRNGPVPEPWDVACRAKLIVSSATFGLRASRTPNADAIARAPWPPIEPASQALSPDARSIHVLPVAKRRPAWPARDEALRHLRRRLRIHHHFAARPRRAVCLAAALSSPFDDSALTYRSQSELSRGCHESNSWMCTRPHRHCCSAPRTLVLTAGEAGHGLRPWSKLGPEAPAPHH